MMVTSDIRKIELNIRKINIGLHFANFANANVTLPLKKRIDVATKNKYG